MILHGRVDLLTVFRMNARTVSDPIAGASSGSSNASLPSEKNAQNNQEKAQEAQFLLQSYGNMNCVQRGRGLAACKSKARNRGHTERAHPKRMKGQNSSLRTSA